MIEQEFQRQVKEGYQGINDKWMMVHFELLVLWTAVAGIAEIIMYFVISESGALLCSANEYWFKYIIVPICLNLSITIIAYGVLKAKKIKIPTKQYLISILYVLLGFALSLMHSGFIAVLVAAIFPILITIMYENQKLTAYVAVTSMVTQFISGYFVLWDPKKIVDNPYLINLIVLELATIFTWFVCSFMIRFMKMKREIIISNDMERYRLQRKVNMDGLTGVGNKLALMDRLNKVTGELNNLHYLVMLDIDEFKIINDTYGHIFGDDVLKCLGDGMRAAQVDCDGYRYGGDEFCILFTEGTLDTVKEKLMSIQNYLKYNVVMSNGDKSVSISMGIACYVKGKTPMELLEQADKALYESKRQRGINKILVYKE